MVVAQSTVFIVSTQIIIAFLRKRDRLRSLKVALSEQILRIFYDIWTNVLFSNRKARADSHRLSALKVRISDLNTIAIRLNKIAYDPFFCEMNLYFEFIWDRIEIAYDRLSSLFLHLSEDYPPSLFCLKRGRSFKYRRKFEESARSKRP